jgi:hypothetical protein
LICPHLAYAQPDSSAAAADTTLKTILDSALTNLPDSLSADSLQGIIQVDTLKPIYLAPFSPESLGYPSIIKKNDIDRLDYRFSGDIFSYSPTGFLQDMGYLGQPAEVYLYNYGFGNISYLADGMPLNNRIFNALDLNSVQSEYIDSLEILPLPSGFIYDNFNNPVSVNFLMRDSISRVPTSRLRYYQGSNDEGYIDAMFNAYLLNRLNGSFQITTAGIDSRYQFSESTLWKASAKLRYMPSNRLNIIGSFSYFDSDVDLNGGVDIDSIRNNVDPAEVDEILYDNFQAPVNYSTRYQKVTSYLYNIKILGKLIEVAPTEIDIFYNSNLTEFRQNEYFDFATQADIPVIVNDNRYKSYGGKFRQLLLLNPLKIDFISRYERSELDATVLKYNDKKTTYSFAGKGELELFNGILRPAVFAKYLYHSNRSFVGFGGELTVNLFDNLSFYGGASRFEKPYSAVEEQYINSIVATTNEKLSVFEVGSRFRSKRIWGSASFFAVSNDNQTYPVIELYNDSLKINEVGFFNQTSIDNHGINLNMNLHLWKVLLSVNASYFNSKLESVQKALPEFSAFGGLYYIDTLFSENLKLKAGLNFRYIGSQNYSTYDFEKNRRVFHQFDPANNSFGLIRNENTGEGYQLDFFLAGLVQDRAMVYFVYQNILAADYYVVPYYPKEFRGIRVGIAWVFLD